MDYQWELKNLEKIKKNGYKVFSTFACGGGSSMGYKLAGYDVLGCNEIDPKMMKVYQKNLNTKFCFLEGIKEFNQKAEYPEELYNLDILDGSPPCSNFSIAGNREKDWGKEKKFREGQSLQVLDTLFFDYIETTKRFQPKVVIAENVKGLLLGNATQYVQKIFKGFEEAGYQVEKWLLNSSIMGVPQARERVFFVGLRNDLCEQIPGPRQTLLSQMPELDLYFDEQPILFGTLRDEDGIDKSHTQRGKWIQERIPKDKCIADIGLRLYNKNSGFNDIIIKDKNVCPTITANGYLWRDYDGKVTTTKDLILCGSFPLDYNFKGMSPKYIIGMSVPPVMVAQISHRIKEQWLDKLPK